MASWWRFTAASTGIGFQVDHFDSGDRAPEGGQIEVAAVDPQGIGAAAAVDRRIRRVPNQNIVAVAADQGIDTGGAVQRVVTGATDKCITAGFTG